MSAVVLREGDRVWLEGVSGWFCGDKESSVHAAQEAIMQALGEDVTYDYLLGVSGLAFRLQVSRTQLCPSSPHACIGWECVKRSKESLPWVAVGLAPSPEAGGTTDTAREARAAVVASIDRGIPAQYGCEEEGLIVGYQKSGEEWLCLHYFHDLGMKERFVENRLPWGLMVFTERKAELPDRRKLALDSLRQAVEMAHAKVVDHGGGGYALGFTAWGEWLHQLRALEEADEATAKPQQHGNAWIYECLAQYRRSAVRYLRYIATEFGAEVEGHLVRAADLYARMVEEVLTDADHCCMVLAPYPHDKERGEHWSAEMRAEQIRRLEAALPLEREAIEEIGKALR